MDPTLSPDVQMQFMRPGQLEAAIRKFPVVYVPFGLIEWHGRHLPLGNDALKAHAILVKCAEQYGGVVYPPMFFPSARYNKEGTFELSDHEYKVPMLVDLFRQLKKTGFRVIIGVSGHNIKHQIQMVEYALMPVTADSELAGAGLWEVTLSHCDDSATDHAAKWETSNMMFFYPDRVDMAALGDGELAPSMQPPDGIGGLDPRKHASAEVGQRNAELASEAIGKKAQELLASLPEDKRGMSIEAIAPGTWWQV